MAFYWNFENGDGTVLGRSEDFEDRSEAESWVGVEFPELLEQGIDQVRLFDDGVEVYGPMSLHP